MADDMHNPTPHPAAERSVVSSVLDWVSRAGTSLVSLLAGLLAAALILYSGYVLYDTFYVSNQAFSSSWDLLQYKPTELLEDEQTPTSGANYLESINRDYRAWLTLYDTNIDYPVVQGENDLYYASHDIYGEISLTGSIYLAAGNAPDFSDSYNLIYGHHMDNKAMFGGLDYYLEESYFNSHREGVLVSRSGVYDLETFAVIKTDAYETNVYSVGNRMEEVLAFLEANIGGGDTTETVYFDASVLDGATKIVALSTCANANTNGRLVVYAVMRQRPLLTLATENYTGAYDMLPHTGSVIVNYSEDTIVLYSTDGGATWTEELPTITNVGTTTVLVRASNPYYGDAAGTMTLTVTPLAVTVTALDSSKRYGQEDPTFAATVEGVIDNFPIVYTVTRPGAGTDEDAGEYPGAILPAGAQLQGNYLVTYIAADFVIVPSEDLTVAAIGHDGVYDAEDHSVVITGEYPEGTTFTYSTDGGTTWTTEAPSIRDVGEVTVLVRAENPNYETATTTVTLRVTPRTVTVTANGSSKLYGAEDPTFTAVVEGVIDDFVIVYTVSRPGGEEETGRYTNAIIPTGAVRQGNYTVVYIAANFVIIGGETPTEPTNPSDPTDPELVDIDDPETPLANILKLFDPTGGSYRPAWALVNLICVILTAYLLLPLLHLKAKYGRGKWMKKINELKGSLQSQQMLPEEEQREAERIHRYAMENRKTEDGSDVTEKEFNEAVEMLYYRVKTFLRRFRFGIAAEVLITILAIVVFVLTEDMRLPMILIDRWTPLMLLILLSCWLVDVILARYRKKVLAEEMEAKEQDEAAQA